MGLQKQINRFNRILSPFQSSEEAQKKYQQEKMQKFLKDLGKLELEHGMKLSPSVQFHPLTGLTPSITFSELTPETREQIEKNLLTVVFSGVP